MTDLVLDNVVCYNRLLYICDIGFYPGLDFGLGLDSRGRGQTLEAEAKAKTLEAEAEAEAGYFGLEAEAGFEAEAESQKIYNICSIT